MDLVFHSLDATTSWLCRVLDAYAKSKHLRFTPRFGWGSEHDTRELVREIESARLVLIWRGDDPGGRWIARLCRSRGRPYLFADNGLLPEQGYFHLDPRGIVGRSSLCGDLGWVTPEHEASYAAHKAERLARTGWTYRGSPDGYVLVPLQDERDSAMYLHSPISTNDELIRLAAQRYPDREIVLRPLAGHRERAIPGLRTRVEVSATVTNLARDAGVVFGLNAPVLSETAMLGVPTVAAAPCPLHYHSDSVETLLAACTARQVPWNTTNLDPWLEALGVSL